MQSKKEQRRFTQLVLMHAHSRNICIDKNKIIEYFTKKEKRNIYFVTY